jgi:hypothetical protein
MRFLFFQRTSDSRFRPTDRPRRGAIFITTTFVFLALTTLALGMVFLSQVYLKVAGVRKSSAQLEYASENGIKTGFHHLLGAMEGVPAPLLLSDLRSLDLIDSVRNGELRILEENLGLQFPVMIHEVAGDTLWQSQTDIQLESAVEGDGYVTAQFRAQIQSLGEIRYLPFRKKSTLDVRIGVAAGHLPLPMFSFLIDKTLDPAQKDGFAQANGISLRRSSRNLLAGAVSASEAPLISRDATPLLEKGLQTKLFRPQDLTNAKLRFALGLENIDEPVPDGVYLMQNSLGLGGIYVVGDVAEMALAIDGTYQVISFQTGAGLWTIRFSPSECKTQFISPQGVTAFDLIPLGIVMVSGKINSLGGGAVDTSGNAAIVQDREVPSLQSGVDLTIVASDKIEITSHLVAEGVQWRDGIPYLKEEQTQLVVYSTGQSFQQGTCLGGGISVAAVAPQDVKIQASLTAQGAGFEIEGNGHTVDLLGSLQTVEYVSGGNQLNICSFLYSAETWTTMTAVPQTAQPVLYFPLLETVEWREL